MALFTMLAPLILVNVWPSILQAGKPAGYVIAGTMLVLGGGSCLACKWLLEKLGIVCFRPLPPSCNSQR